MSEAELPGARPGPPARQPRWGGWYGRSRAVRPRPCTRPLRRNEKTAL